VISATEQIRRYCTDANHAAFADFYRAQAPRLWKFLIARGCDRESAYDILAEAFLRFIRTVCRDPRAPVALLYRIAINLHVDYYRRTKIAPEDSSTRSDELDIAGAPEPEEHGHVRALIKKLRSSEQNLLLLRYWIGLSHEEVAHALAMPEGTVRRQCAEALANLRTLWNEHEKRYGTG